MSGVEFYTTTEKAFAMTARVVLEELSGMLEKTPGRCGKMCEDCPMMMSDKGCMFDLILPALRKIEEGE